MLVSSLVEWRCYNLVNIYLQSLGWGFKWILTTTFNTGKSIPLCFVCSFILDFMNSVEISELNFVFDVFILVWSKEKMIPFRKVAVLIFRLARKNQKMKQEIRNSVARENIWPEVIVCPETILKVFRNAYVGFYGWEIVSNEFSCTVVL